VASTDAQPAAYGAEPAHRAPVTLLSVLRRRWLIVVLSALLAGGAAAAFAFASRDSYESTAKLLFSQTIGPEFTALGLPPTAPDADNLAQNNVATVDSRRVAEATSEELRRQGVEMSPVEVDEDVTVSAAKDTDVVDVVATASEPEEAARLANTYAETAAALIAADNRRLARRALVVVRRQLKDLSRRDRRGPVGRNRREDAARLKTLIAVGTGPRIIQEGFVPEEEAGSRAQTIALGTLFGLLLGMGLALLREQADRRLRHSEDMALAFDAPVLTTVPRSRKLKKKVPFAQLPANVSEAFRMLQMNLRFTPGPPVRSVLVTSARNREGKTTVAWNLACAASSAGLSVTLVEADLRRPVIAQRYGLERRPGLSEVLRGELPVREALQEVPTLAGDPGSNGRLRPLTVLVAGEPPADPWALLQSPLMVKVLAKVSADLVVIDAPPIPHVADAISLLGRVDGVLVCASVNSTRGPDAGRLRDQLEALDARVLGVVANGGSAATGYAYGPAATSGRRPPARAPEPPATRPL
jgi:succinoglycan biosynthesis transport protein ExoP